jgi:hypothetical protein
MSALLEPEEVEQYTSGGMPFEQLNELMLKRLPGGGEFAVTRLTRAMGIRLEPATVEQFFEALNQDGIDPFGLFGKFQMIPEEPPPPETQQNA